MELDFFLNEKTPEHFATEAAREAIVQLDAVEAPAGEMTVVLGPGWPGILLHEAVGHGLEADFNRKGVSAFSGRIGQKVASALCTVVDDGTIGSRRGSLNVDDEGATTQRNVLIENGDSARLPAGQALQPPAAQHSTGSGRRESYAHIPMPRMTNTFMLAGESDPEEIIRSVPKGLYCANFGGGQVDITSGNFVFSASESYLIEDGKLTRPVRNATLIGNGPEALKYVSMVGNDLRLDEGIGDLRQGRAERAGGRRHPDHQDRPHDRGRHGLSRTITSGSTARCTSCKLAPRQRRDRRRVHHRRRRGVLRQRAHARSRNTEGGRFARRRPARPDRASTRARPIPPISPRGIAHMVSSAIELAEITTEDPHAGLPDAIRTRLARTAISAVLRRHRATGTRASRSTRRQRPKQPRSLSTRGSPTPKARRSTRTWAGTFSPIPAALLGELPHQLLLAQHRAGGARRRGYGARLLVHRRAQLRRPGEAGRHRPHAAERALRRLGAVKVETQKVPVVFEPRTARSLLGQYLRGGRRRLDLPPRVVPRRQARREGGVRERSRWSTTAPSPAVRHLAVRRRRRAVAPHGGDRARRAEELPAEHLHGAQAGHEDHRQCVARADRERRHRPRELLPRKGRQNAGGDHSSIPNGFYVTELMGFGVNIVTGDYSRGAAGLWIGNGELAFAVSEVTIAGNAEGDADGNREARLRPGVPRLGGGAYNRNRRNDD